MKGGFTVENLPQGIVFKKPFNYGSHQAKAIMEAEGQITFKLHSEEEDRSNSPSQQLSPDHTSNQNVSFQDIIRSTLRKIVGEEAVNGILAAAETGSSHQSISEEQVEVEDLCLTQEERLVLYTHCSSYFDVDAWSAVGHNLKVNADQTGVVLPVYTEALDESYWLFYCHHISLRDILKPKQGKAKLQGYWLNLVDAGNNSLKYDLLLPSPGAYAEIQFRWIIKCDHGPLYFEHTLEVREGVQFVMPVLFKDCILTTLRKSNII